MGIMAKPEEPDVGDSIVFYGSLMRDYGQLKRLGVGDRLQLIGPCRLAGALFDLGAYPGFRPLDQKSGASVVAESYEILDIGIITSLDAFENYIPARPIESLYLRRQVTLIEPAGAKAWVYIYNQTTEGRARVKSGDWLAYCETRSQP